jgi:predicted restriction endonuclease
MDPEIYNIEKYSECFSSLHTAKKLGVPAPHKAVLLLSVIDLIECGVITSNEIELSERLEQQFKHNWDRYVGRSVVFKPMIGTPFFHLHSEPFWTLVPFEGGEERIQELKKSNPYSVGTMRNNFRGAKIDTELFDLLHDEDVRAKLRVVLISTYLQPQKRVIDTVIPAVLVALLVA